MTPVRRTLDRRIELPPVRVFTDDLERIVEILDQLPGTTRLIETDEHELQRADELSSLERVTELRIRCGKHSDMIWVLLGRSDAYVSCRSADPAWRGAAEDAADVLRRRVRHGAAILRWCTIPLVVIGVSMFVLTAVVQSDAVRAGLLLGFIACVALLVGSFFNALRRHAIIVPDRRTNASTFWSRNSDALLLNAISAAVGFALGFLGGRL